MSIALLAITSVVITSTLTAQGTDITAIAVSEVAATNIEPTETPSLENAMFLIDSIKALYTMATGTVDDIKKNGLDPGSLVELIFFVILPALILLIRLLIFILLTAKIFTGPGGDKTIDKIIDKLSPIQAWLTAIKDRKKKPK